MLKCKRICDQKLFNINFVVYNVIVDYYCDYQVKNILSVSKKKENLNQYFDVYTSPDMDQGPVMYPDFNQTYQPNLEKEDRFYSS